LYSSVFYSFLNVISRSSHEADHGCAHRNPSTWEVEQEDTEFRTAITSYQDPFSQKKKKKRGLTSVILDTQEAEIRRIVIGNQSGQIDHDTIS
jgi:predicted nucleotidyltransferase